MNLLQDFFEAIVNFTYPESNRISNRGSTDALHNRTSGSTLRTWFLGR